MAWLLLLILTLLSCTVSSSSRGVVFNVLDYGASTLSPDNTAAFSACLAALVAAGGGRVYLPAGTYKGRLIIPPVSSSPSGWLTVEIAGDVEPTPRFGTVGTLPFTSHNSTAVLQSVANASGLSVVSAAAADGGFSAVYVVISNLEVRTQDDPTVGGIDLLHAQQCKLQNVFVNTGIYDVQASRPTHGTAGVTTPAINNGALTILRNVAVTGYTTGIVANEHTDGDGITVCGNLNGISFSGANHASRFGRIGAFRNAVHLNVTGRHGFSVQQLAIENAGPGQTTPQNKWQALIFDIADPKNYGVADVVYWVVEGNVGPVTEFSQNGGATIQARRIGARNECEFSDSA